MKRILAATAVALFAAPAFADVQLANSLGLDRNAVTTSQLAQAHLANDNEDTRFFRSGSNDIVSTQSVGGSMGNQQLKTSVERSLRAHAINVDVSTLSDSQIAALFLALSGSSDDGSVGSSVRSIIN